MNFAEARLAIYFDLSSIPQNTTITEAIFKIYKYGNFSIYWNKNTFYLYQLSQKWDENGANWTKRNRSANWNTAGGDYVKPEIATYQYDGQFNGWFTFNVTKAVNEMIKNPATNFGFMVLIKDMNPGSIDEMYNVYAYFHSSEAADAGLTPRLVIKKTGTSVVEKQHANNSFQVKLIGNLLQLDLAEKYGNNVTITITDIAGKTVSRQKLEKSGNTFIIPLPFSSGVYCISVSAQGLHERRKVILY
jgi:hypothetical protein